MKVTIFTNCNNSKNLEQTIKSVLNQTYTNFEYFLYDDGSIADDNIWNMIIKYQKIDSRIISAKLKKQKNLSVLLNKCIDEMTGDIFVWCPCGVIFEKQLLEKKLKFNLTNPDAVIFNDVCFIDENHKIISAIKIKYYTPEYFKELVFKGQPIDLAGSFIPKKLFSRTGKFPEHLDMYEDYYWIIKATIDDINFLGISEFLHYAQKNISEGKKIYDCKIISKIRIELLEYKTVKFNNEPYFPKKIYFFWGSLDQKISWMRFMSIKTFKMFNPDWEIILCYSNCTINKSIWKSPTLQDFYNYKSELNYLEELKKLNIKFSYWDIPYELFPSLASYKLNLSASHKSNIFKYYMLYKYGGIYSDMDILYFRPIEQFYNIIKTYDVIWCENPILSIGFLGTSKTENEFFKDIFFNSFKNFDSSRYQCLGVESIFNLYNGQRKILDIATKKYKSIKFYEMPFSIVYPFVAKFGKMRYMFTKNISMNLIPKDCIGYHWYAGHPLAQALNNELTETNYKQQKCIFSSIMNFIEDSNTNNIEKN